MMNDKVSAPMASREKRDPGFVQIRRGLKEHLHRSKMSSNGAKLYLWCHLSAAWFGPNRGCVETDYHTIARSLGWGTRMIQRVIAELNGRYIEVKLAANQHELTTIRILKFDTKQTNSGVDTGVQSYGVGVDSGVDRALDKGVHSSVHSDQRNSQSQNGLQAPKKSIEVIEERRKEHDAVRRRFDAEQRLSSKRVFSPSEKKQKLAERLAAKIREHRESYLELIEYCRMNGSESPFGKEEREAFAMLQYDVDLTNPLLTCGFVDAVVDVCEAQREADVLPGNLCSKVIDLCESRRSSGWRSSGCYYPPDFVDHRNRLRAMERASEGPSRSYEEVRV